MTILFPCDALHPRQVEPDFASQAQAAQGAGLGVLRLDSDAFMQGDISRALRFVGHSEQFQVLVYRGWMLRAELYHTLFNALLERNWHLLN